MREAKTCHFNRTFFAYFAALREKSLPHPDKGKRKTQGVSRQVAEIAKKGKDMF
jgi:hypothetical protein